MKSILAILILLSLPLPVQALTRVIAVEITQANEKTFASVFFDDENLSKKDISVEEAAKILNQIKSFTGGNTSIGIIAYNVPLKAYMPILKSIAENVALTFSFLEGGSPEVQGVIKRKIESKS